MSNYFLPIKDPLTMVKMVRIIKLYLFPLLVSQSDEGKWQQWSSPSAEISFWHITALMLNIRRVQSTWTSYKNYGISNSSHTSISARL